MKGIRTLRRGFLTTCLVVVAAIAVACGAGATPNRTAAPSGASATGAPDVTLRPISDVDAMNLTLQAADFGPSFAGYVPAQSTAQMRLADLEGDPCTVNLLSALKRWGFEGGYNSDWVRPDGVGADKDLSVGSYVEIFPDANAAHVMFDFDKKSAVEPLPADCGVEIRSSSTFEVDPIMGEEAFGYRRTVADDSGALHTYTWVEFRRGRMLASPDVIREDSRDTADEVASYARLLDQRILHSLSAPE
jgi:hypothetical protein